MARPRLLHQPSSIRTSRTLIRVNHDDAARRPGVLADEGLGQGRSGSGHEVGRVVDDRADKREPARIVGRAVWARIADLELEVREALFNRLAGRISCAGLVTRTASSA